MNKTYHLKKIKEIDQIFKKRVSKGSSNFVVYVGEPCLVHFRFCLSIGKKYGNAVKRNLCKRRVREIINFYKEELDKKDFVVVIKPDSRNLTYEEMKQELFTLFKKTKIIVKKGENND
ncbi:MAG: ribonuclease P protein component [Acholeplasmatales bacterium]|jgi:ribonuclease P protein component|nr:ribonuclease P protein component [Acholeplasmatales bacterium]